MNNRWCSACGKEFRPCPKAPKQSYCSEPGCQRERRRLWQQAKRRSDPDYLDNQARAQQAWCQRNPDYWRAYQAMKKQAEARRKTRGTAHEQGVQAAYQNVCSGIETQGQRKKKTARIKLVLKMRGISHRSASS
jgi:hypothetical protein